MLRTMSTNATPDGPLLDALLDSWDRNNAILVNLLRALPDDALDLRASDGSPTLAQLFIHIHYCRLLFVAEDAPEHAAPLPQGGEWRKERDRERIAAMLNASALVVRHAVSGRLAEGRDMEVRYDHPILMLQHMVWHEGYHHGQIKVAMKAAGRPFDDEDIGPMTWDLWMEKGKWPPFTA